MIDCDVAPFDQTLSVAEEDVNVTDPPSQNVVAPLAVIVGVAGIGCTITFVARETPEGHPRAITSTEYEPEVVTVMLCVVSPVDQILSVADDEVSTMLSPSQKVVAPPAVIVGTAGTGLTITVLGADADDEHPAVVTVTL